MASQNPLALVAVDSESLCVQTTLFLADSPPITVEGLIDSGCTVRGLADQALIQTHRIPTHEVSKPFGVDLADGKVAGIITHYVLLDMKVGQHAETSAFFITSLSSENPIILGLPWLQRHNPTIDWPSLSIVFQSPYCLRYCCPNPCAAPTVTDPSSEEPIEIRVPGEPPLTRYQAIQDILDIEALPAATDTLSKHPLPTVESVPQDTPQAKTGPELQIDATLTPGHDHHLARPSTTSPTKTCARMKPTPRPIAKVAGSRRNVRRKKTPLPR